VKNEIFCHSHINECQSYKHSILTVLAQIRADFKVKKQKWPEKKKEDKLKSKHALDGKREKFYRFLALTQRIV